MRACCVRVSKRTSDEYSHRVRRVVEGHVREGGPVVAALIGLRGDGQRRVHPGRGREADRRVRVRIAPCNRQHNVVMGVGMGTAEGTGTHSSLQQTTRHYGCRFG